MFSFFLPVLFRFRTPTGRSRLIQMHWLPSNGEGEERKEEILLGVRAGWFLFGKEREREREKDRGNLH